MADTERKPLTWLSLFTTLTPLMAIIASVTLWLDDRGRSEWKDALASHSVHTHEGAVGDDEHNRVIRRLERLEWRIDSIVGRRVEVDGDQFEGVVVPLADGGGIFLSPDVIASRKRGGKWRRFKVDQ